MDRQPLATKVRPPPLPTRLVERPRLIAQIEEDPAPVTLIAGPAGSGKTVLLTRWQRTAQAAGARVAWVTLDARDDDPRVLTHLLATSLRLAGAEANGGMRDVPELPSDHGLPVLFGPATTDGTVTWLVLDEVEHLRSPAALDLLDGLLQLTHDTFRVIVSTRRDPQIALHRRRLDGSLREVRTGDLAFRTEEVAALLRDRGIAFDQGFVELLTTRTEGWAATLRIAMIALATADDPADLIRRFDGDDHAVADYLVAEVLAGETPDRRDFLLRTSVCPQLPVELAQVLTGRQDAGRVLESLEHEQLLTSRTGRSRATYRYHDLLRSYLRAELRRSDPAAHRELQLTAADWFLERGEHLRGIEQLIEASSAAAISAALRLHGLRTVFDGQARELLRQLRRLPPPASRDATVAWVAAAAGLFLDDRAEAELWIDRAEAATPDRDDPWLAIIADTVRLWQHAGDPPARGALTARLDADGSSVTDPELRRLVRFARALAALGEGRPAAARHRLEPAEEPRAGEHGALQLATRSLLASIAAVESDLPALRHHGRHGVELAAQQGWIHSPHAAPSHLALAWHAYLVVDRPTAEEHAQHALLALGRRAPVELELAVRACALLTTLDRAPRQEAEGRSDVGGDHEAALREATSLYCDRAPEMHLPVFHAAIAPLLIRLCLGDEHRRLAERVAELAGAALTAPGETALIRNLLRPSTTRAWPAELPDLVGLEEAWAFGPNRILALLDLADLAYRRGCEAKGHSWVVDAVGASAPDGLLRPFVFAGPRVAAALVHDLGRFGRWEAHAQAAARLVGASTYGSTAAGLTVTERELLRELPSLLSFGEIAAARSISTNTVKTHLRAIYRKLEVSSRRDAVETARRRGLL